MKRTSTLFFAGVLVCLFASRAQAQGTASWASGYPKPDCLMPTTFDAQGTATASCGYTFTGTGTVYYWPQGSGIQQSASITVDVGTGNWVGRSGTLTSGTTYNVVVQINLQNAMMGTMVTIATDPATVTAP